MPGHGTSGPTVRGRGTLAPTTPGPCQVAVPLRQQRQVVVRHGQHEVERPRHRLRKIAVPRRKAALPCFRLHELVEPCRVPCCRAVDGERSYFLTIVCAKLKHLATQLYSLAVDCARREVAVLIPGEDDVRQGRHQGDAGQEDGPQEGPLVAKAKPVAK